NALFHFIITGNCKPSETRSIFVRKIDRRCRTRGEMSNNNTSINPRQQILHSQDSEPTGRTVEMPQGIDDFKIVIPELTDMAACELKVYEIGRASCRERV